LNKIKEKEIVEKGYSKDIFSKIDKETNSINNLINELMSNPELKEGYVDKSHTKYILVALKTLRKDMKDLDQKIREDIQSEGLKFFVEIEKINELIKEVESKR